MLRRITVLLGLIFLSGCATPIPKSLTIPVFSGKPTATIGVAVADHRTFITNGNKEEWFEGIFRSGFGIPHSLSRVDEFKEKPFSFYLASKLKESLETAGSTVTVIPIEKGTSVKQIVDKIRDAELGSSLAVVIHKSRYDIGPFNPEYAYHFELLVFDSVGRQIARKEFMSLEQQLPLSEKYNLFDMMSQIYKTKFDSFMADPDIKNALNATAAGH
jgi:hypothetical protein